MSDNRALIEEIAARTQEAVELARQRVIREEPGRRRDWYNLLATNLEGYRAALLDGKLPAPGAGIGWGAIRALDDWGLNDREMTAAVEAAEGLYRDSQ